MIYYVVGNPVSQSLSPMIHHSFAKQIGKTITYDRHCIAPGQFNAAIDHMRRQHVNGVNVTIPFKVDAFNYATEHTDRAKLAHAVNTLCFNSVSVLGDNTDGAGLVNDIIRNLKWNLAKQRILIIGAGGAARGIIAPILAEKPDSIALLNRTTANAAALAKQFAQLTPIDVLTTDQVTDTISSFDMIINTAALNANALSDLLPKGIDLKHTVCYDINYTNTTSAFLSWACDNHANAIANGLGMLVEQAALSFALWHNVTVDTAPVLALLRKQ